MTSSFKQFFSASVFMSQNNAKKFSSEDLKQFDGSNGKPLYVVFKGKVYDLSTSQLWLEGKHMGMHTRNDDLAEAIKTAPHGEDNVFSFPLVGELAEAIFASSNAPAVEKKPGATGSASYSAASSSYGETHIPEIGSRGGRSNHDCSVAFNSESWNFCASANYNRIMANRHRYKHQQTDKPHPYCFLLSLNQHSELPCKIRRGSNRRHRTRKGHSGFQRDLPAFRMRIRFCGSRRLTSLQLRLQSNYPDGLLLLPRLTVRFRTWRKSNWRSSSTTRPHGSTAAEFGNRRHKRGWDAAADDFWAWSAWNHESRVGDAV